MALVKPSGTISTISGKVGGLIFANSGAGLTVRSFTAPVNRNTIRQNNQRIIIDTMQQEWRLLTPTQRDCWALWIRLFPIKQNNFNGLPINAQQAFIKINSTLRLYSHPIIKDPLFRASILEPNSYNMNLVGGTLILTSIRIMDNSLEFIELFCTVVLPATRNNPGTLLKTMLFTTTNGTIHDITTAYINVFGKLPTVGQKIFFKAKTIDLLTGTSPGFQQESVTFT